MKKLTNNTFDSNKYVSMHSNLNAISVISNIDFIGLVRFTREAN